MIIEKPKFKLNKKELKEKGKLLKKIEIAVAKKYNGSINITDYFEKHTKNLKLNKLLNKNEITPLFKRKLASAIYNIHFKTTPFKELKEKIYNQVDQIILNIK